MTIPSVLPLLKHLPIRTPTERRVERLLHDLVRPTRPMPRPTLWSASWETLHSLCTRIRTAPDPITMCEFGSGTSTAWFALAARAAGGGHVHSVDHELRYADRTRELLTAQGVAEWATVHHGPLAPSARNQDQPWYDERVFELVPAGINLVFVDGPVASLGSDIRYPALPTIADKLADHCTVVLDDTHRAKEQAIWERWISELSDEFLITVEPALSRSTAMLLQRR
ncbi:class I SAM-dependent methyltransferase [Propionibacteriaceae bacterium Y1685]|uniref:class I SAM-dependent methyltransferase n=1 Tax=Microlunatus sp. Y1700 TaxID=3418487 RepID=UPI003B787ECB